MTHKIIIGFCVCFAVGAYLVAVVITTQGTFQQQESTAATQQQAEQSNQPKTNPLASSTYYTSSYGAYSQFYYPEQCSRFAYRIPPMFRKQFDSLEALQATYSGRTLDPDCLYLVREH